VKNLRIASRMCLDEFHPILFNKNSQEICKGFGYQMASCVMKY
jgi:hypothetical protein